MSFSLLGKILSSPGDPCKQFCCCRQEPIGGEADDDRSEQEGDGIELVRLKFQFGPLALTVGAPIAAVSSLGLGGNASAATPKAPSATDMQYYVAVGDSLGAGNGASQPANGSVNLVYQHELAQYPNLQFVNLSQPGATTDVIRHHLASSGRR